MNWRKAVLFASAVVLITGCGQRSGNWKADSNGIFVARDGHVESALVYTSEHASDGYTQEALASYIEAAVAEYIAEYGDSDPKTPLVELKSCKLENQTGTVVFSYASPDEFVRFAKETGDDTHTVTELSVEKPDPSGKGTVKICITGAATVFTGGKIVEISDDGVTVLDDCTAVTGEGEHVIIFQ